MNSSEYWEKRLANVVWNSYNTLEEENIALLDHYGKAMNNIRTELMKLEEQKTLSRSDKYRVQHLKSIQGQILKECEKLGSSVEKDTIKNVSRQMQDVYKASFSNISNKQFSQLSKNSCKDMINTPWHGSSFSERLWKNTGKLANELNDILASGITEGKTIAEIAFQLSNRMNKDMNSCHGLVRTETINSLNRASMRGMRDAGVEYVRWWAAQDERKCDECGANHDKIYPIDKAPNLPCHPGCRCTWLPVSEDELTNDDIQQIYNLSNNERYAINQYVSSESYKINDVLRRGLVLDDDLEQTVQNLDKALDKLECYKGDISRSLHFMDTKAKKIFLSEHAVGKVVTYPEYLSTTCEGVYDKTGNVQIYIQDSKQGKDLSLINKNEKEVLYQRGSSFKVVYVEEKNGKTFILLEEV